MRHVGFLVGVIYTIHCGGTAVPETAPAPSPQNSAVDAGSSAPVAAPAEHRPASTACRDPRPAGVPSTTGGDCRKDADCVKGSNGRCVSGPQFSLVCWYDECSLDTDCGAGVCDCRNDAYHSANVCFRGNCVTDGDCGVGGFCSPSATVLFDNCRSNVPAGSFGYFCRTARDACTRDSDCDRGSCIFATDTQRWQCLPRICSRGGGP